MRVLIYFGQKVLFDPDRNSGQCGYAEIGFPEDDSWNDVIGVVTTEGRHVNLGGLSGLHLKAEFEAEEGDFKVSYILSGREQLIDMGSRMVH